MECEREKEGERKRGKERGVKAGKGTHQYSTSFSTPHPTTLK
jgi:hypothetical protein